MSDAPDDPDAGRPDPCCVCGRPSTHSYDGREDCPVCDRPACGLRVQAAIDYHADAGDRG